MAAPMFLAILAVAQQMGILAFDSKCRAFAERNDVDVSVGDRMLMLQHQLDLGVDIDDGSNAGSSKQDKIDELSGFSKNAEQWRGLLIGVAPYALAWHCLYWLCWGAAPYLFTTYAQLDKVEDTRDQAYWAASMVSTMHAIYITVLAFVAIWETPAFLTSSDFLFSTSTSLLSCHIFIGYTVADLVLTIYYGSKWAGFETNLAHHIAIILAWCQLTSGGYGQCMALVGVICEITTPFVNMRWFLDKSGMKESKLYLFNGIMMLVTFFLFRVVMYTAVAQRIYAQRAGLLSLPLLNQIVFLGCYALGGALQYFWFYKVCRGAYKTLTGGKSGGGDQDSGQAARLAG